MVKRILERRACSSCLYKLANQFFHFPELDIYSVRPLETRQVLDGILHT